MGQCRQPDVSVSVTGAEPDLRISLCLGYAAVSYGE